MLPADYQTILLYLYQSHLNHHLCNYPYKKDYPVQKNNGRLWFYIQHIYLNSSHTCPKYQIQQKYLL